MDVLTGQSGPKRRKGPGGEEAGPDRAYCWTNGSSQGLDLALRALVPRGSTVLVESATYFLAADTIRNAGADVASVPLDPATGINLDALEATVAEYARTPEKRVTALYCIPSFQNPTGAMLSLEDRQRLVELSRRYNFYVISDDVYQWMHFVTPAGDRRAWAAPPYLTDFDEARADDPDECGVVSLNTFSKLLGPGLRLGWLQTHASRADRILSRVTKLGFLQSGGGLNPFAATIVSAAIESGAVTAHVETMRDEYSALSAHLAACVREQAEAASLSDHVSFVEPKGGYFVWIRVAGVDTRQLLARAKAANDVLFKDGRTCDALRSDDWSDYLRLSFAFQSLDDISEGVRRLFVHIVAELEEPGGAATAGTGGHVEIS
jgi:DNA-binding transcriptional MocR family regulator